MDYVKSTQEKWTAEDPVPTYGVGVAFWHVCIGKFLNIMAVLWLSFVLMLRQRKHSKIEKLHLHYIVLVLFNSQCGGSHVCFTRSFFHPTKTKSSETRAIWRTLVEFNELFACLILIIVLPTLIDTFLPHTSYNHNNIFVMFHPYHLFLMYDFKVLLYLFFLLKIIRVNYTWVN
jgi:hypothetical protein